MVFADPLSRAVGLLTAGVLSGVAGWSFRSAGMTVLGNLTVGIGVTAILIFARDLANAVRHQRERDARRRRHEARVASARASRHRELSARLHFWLTRAEGPRPENPWTVLDRYLAAVHDQVVSCSGAARIVCARHTGHEYVVLANYGDIDLPGDALVAGKGCSARSRDFVSILGSLAAYADFLQVRVAEGDMYLALICDQPLTSLDPTVLRSIEETFTTLAQRLSALLTDSGPRLVLVSGAD
jgi:hypothetical protein